MKTVEQRQWMSTVTAGAGSGTSTEMVVSTASPDRMGDVIRPEGARVANFLKNPVLMFGHNYAALPVGTVQAIEVMPGSGLKMQFRWLEGDEVADRVRNAWDQGVLRAASIGFQPLHAVPNRSGVGLTFTEWELLEVSLVPVPANPEAVRTLKALGLSPARRIEQWVLERAVPTPFRREPSPEPPRPVHPDLRGMGVLPGELLVPLDPTGVARPVDLFLANWRSQIAPHLRAPGRSATDDEEIIVLADDGDDIVELPCDAAELGPLIRTAVRDSLAQLRRTLEGGR
jgi:HK97 family phage prohead protease